MSKNIGVMVMRVQTPHLTRAHMALIREVDYRSDRAVVVLGESPIKLTMRDPMPASVRKRMVEELWGSNIDYLKLGDVPDSDQLWSDNLDALLLKAYPGDNVTLYGARDSFIPYYHGRFETVTLELAHCEGISATQIREEIYRGEYRYKDNDSYNAGFIAAAAVPYPTSYQTVDVAAIVQAWTSESRDGVKSPCIILGRKPGRKTWCLPGGFVDPELDLAVDGMMLEGAAARELSEESAIFVSANEFKYLGSYRIDDPRYRKASHKIGTALFLVDVSYEAWQQAVASDDLAKIQLFALERLDMSLVQAIHHPLIERVKKALNIS